MEEKSVRNDNRRLKGRREGGGREERKEGSEGRREGGREGGKEGRKEGSN